jgi:hypothetical protein
VIGHLSLGVRELEAAASFYVRILQPLGFIKV